MSDDDSQIVRLRRIEVATAILLSAAGLISAWASYQAALWGGVQANHYAAANGKVTEASRLSIVDGQRVATDMLLFTAWLEAAADNDTKRMMFFERRFSPEMHADFDPWRARMPADLRTALPDANAPQALPRPGYREGVSAQRLQKAAVAEFKEGDTANGIGDRFVAATVVLSTVLFLGGISPLLRSTRVRMAMLVLAGVLGIAASVFIFTLPVAAL